jgi:hypothetical protein
MRQLSVLVQRIYGAVEPAHNGFIVGNVQIRSLRFVEFVIRNSVACGEHETAPNGSDNALGLLVRFAVAFRRSRILVTIHDAHKQTLGAFPAITYLDDAKSFEAFEQIAILESLLGQIASKPVRDSGIECD